MMMCLCQRVPSESLWWRDVIPPVSVLMAPVWKEELRTSPTASLWRPGTAGSPLKRKWQNSNMQNKINIMAFLAGVLVQVVWA